jgi:hypothetical protein
MQPLANREEIARRAEEAVQCRSWVIRNRETKAVVCETFNPRVVTALNTQKYEAVSIGEYLASLNRRGA